MLALASRAVADRPVAAHPPDAGGHLRHRDLLRRRGHHAGDLGALGGRRPGGRGPGLHKLHRAGHAGGADRAVPGAASRHREHGPLLRADHGAVVRRAGADGRRAHRAQPGDPRGAQPALRASPSSSATRASPSSRSARSCCASPAPRRSTPTWATSARADPPGLVQPGDAGARDQLLRPGRHAARPPGEREEPVLRDGAELGALPADRAGDGGDGDRLAGAHHGRLFGHQAGDPARLPAAPARAAHLGARDRADLPAVRELGPVRLHRARRRAVRLEQQAGRRLRHGGDDRHAHHDDHDLLRDPLRLEVPLVAVRGGDGLLLPRRLRLLLGQHRQGARRRLVPDRHRRGRCSCC